MAGEITLAGQFATYGGPQVTLFNSTIGNAVVSILSREGTGSARGWKSFVKGQADFLNTKKILYPGETVLVNAIALPMDFPLQTLTSEQNLTLEDGVQNAPLTVDAAWKTGAWKVESSSNLTSPTYSLNGSAFAALAVNQVLNFALNDVLEIEGEVGDGLTGKVRLIPNV